MGDRKKNRVKITDAQLLDYSAEFSGAYDMKPPRLGCTLDVCIVIVEGVAV